MCCHNCLAGRATCDATPGPARDETCNDVDDDCDGEIDEEAVCERYLVESCRVFIGHAVNVPPLEDVLPPWNGCGFNGEDIDGGNRCVSTSGDERMHTAPFNPARDGTTLVAGFACSGRDLALDAWMQRHCGLALGVSAGADLADVDVDACPAAWPLARDGDPRCVTSGGDALFHPLVLDRTLTPQTLLGLAFGCQDDAHPDRVARLNAGTRVDWMVFTGDAPVLQCRLVLPRTMDPDEACRPREAVTSVCGFSEDAPGMSPLVPPGRLEACWGVGAALRLVP